LSCSISCFDAFLCAVRYTPGKRTHRTTEFACPAPAVASTHSVKSDLAPQRPRRVEFRVRLAGLSGRAEAIVRHVTNGGNCPGADADRGRQSRCVINCHLSCDKAAAFVVSPLIAPDARPGRGACSRPASRRRCLNSTLSFDETSEVEARLLAGDLDLLYIAPERLLTPRCLALLGRARIALFCDRRGALRVAMGTRLSTGIYRPVGDIRAFSLTCPRVALTATADEAYPPGDRRSPPAG